MAGDSNSAGSDLATEVARLRASGALGESGRLLELFDYLAARGEAAEPASQAEIADAVFGQQDAEGDDATVRVYIHRLRKRLEKFYAADRRKGIARLVIPAGTYALRLAPHEAVSLPHPAQRLPWPIVLAAVLVVAAFAAGWLVRPAGSAAQANPIWQKFVASDRPIVIAVGDYYIFGEYDHEFPQITRLVRDFEIGSPTDLARAQESDPEHYGRTEDMGLNYLPFSSAYGLAELVPVLSEGGKKVSVMPASAVTSDTFRDSNVVYVGLMSGMGLLEEVNFMGSNFAIGENYDELIDIGAQRRYMSEEAMSLASARYYKDYGYLSVFREPGGALVAIVAGARDTGLRGLAPIVSGADLPEGLETLAEGNEPRGYEALFEITGQQGSDLGEKLVAAKARP